MRSARTTRVGGCLPTGMKHWSHWAPIGVSPIRKLCPWIVVLFEQRHGFNPDGSVLHNYYVKESVGIAAGLFIVPCITWVWRPLPTPPAR